MSETHGYDPEARVARLAERVDNQGVRINHLEAVVTKGFSDMNSQVSAQFNALTTEMRTRDRTPWSVIWPAMGVMFAILFGIGGALYYPVRETMSETKMDIRQLKVDTLSVAAFQDFRASYEANRTNSRNEYIDKFSQLTGRLEKLDDRTAKKDEISLARELYDAKINGVREVTDARITDLQRQIDELKGRRSPLP